MAVFEIFCEEKGLWRVCRSDGLVEGMFRDRKGALRFAKSESLNNDAMIRFHTGPIA